MPGGAASAETTARILVGDEVVSIDGQPVNVQSLTVAALKEAGGGGGRKSEDLTRTAIVNALLLGSKGSLATLILKRRGGALVPAGSPVANSAAPSKLNFSV